MATLLLGLLASGLVTLIPATITIAVLWWLDRYEKEPLWLLGIMFFWGAVPTIIMSLLAQILLDVPVTALLGDSILTSMTSAGLVAPLTEETFKALILLIMYLVYRKEFDGVTDGILYGALVGFGFSVVENVLYFMGSLFEGGWSAWGTTVAFRVGLYHLNHSLFAACVGVGFGLARNARETWKRLLYPFLGWLVAVTLHATHNGGIVLSETTSGLSCLILTVVDWMGALGMLILIVLAVQRERRWLAELDAEVKDGFITDGERQVAIHYRMRLARGWRVLGRHGVLTWFRWNRFVQMIVDLGYRKHQKRRAGEDAKIDTWIAELRQRIVTARLGLPQMEE
ncbi:MAG: PrsW family intramembrane metalloprotease [Anaerolineae bacterium]|nr:PrsW family intramembrane metalloprotease [Anaerolineae bacterium]